MRKFSFHEALNRHPEITDDPVSVRSLMEHFKIAPSVAQLLRRMGPFNGYEDGFRFENDFAITFEQGEDFLNVLTDAVVDGVVERAIGLYIGKLEGIDLNPIPGLETRIPDEVLDFVYGRLETELLARIADMFTNPMGSDYGRCGGMAFAGYDFYLAGIPIDTTITSPPAEGPLGDYIYDRLLDSLRLNIGTFLDWKVDLKLRGHLNLVAKEALAAAIGTVVFGPIGAAILAYIAAQTDIFGFPSGEEILLDSSKREWAKLKEVLDQQAAWPLGLVKDGWAPWKDHQVLAIGYTDDATGQSLSIWDNENGASEDTLVLDFGGGELTTSGAYTNVKGIFRERYSVRRPPESLGP